MTGPSRFLLGGLLMLILAALAVVFWPHPAGAQRACAPVVVDGDTFTACGQRIRISNIDAPELRGRCASERRLALRARNRLVELLRQPYRLVRSGRDRDRYGRLLRVVVTARGDVGDQLVREGLARTWTGRREPWC